MSRVRSFAGMILVLISVAGFVLWEAGGRSLLCDIPLAAASEDVYPGTVLSEENLVIQGFPKEYQLENAVTKENASALFGKKAKQFIPKGSQITGAFVAEEHDIVLKEGQSIYCVDESMIDMVSSSLRRGDQIHIYGEAGKVDLGSYTAAFVKDTADREVKNQESLKHDTPLERENSNYTISRIEIVCTRDEYASLCDYVSLSGNGLTIVQEVAS